MPNPEVFDKIFYYKDALKDPQAIIDLIEISDKDLNDSTSIPKWQEWSASGDVPYVFGYQKRFTDKVDIDNNMDIQAINSALKNAIAQVSSHYAKVNNIDIGSLAPLSVSKYSTGKSMGPHVDDYDDGENPNISVVLYLNDNYIGGELHFPEQGVTIKPEAGSIVVFPSTAPYYHESLPVQSGTKYMSPGFWRKNNKVV